MAGDHQGYSRIGFSRYSWALPKYQGKIVAGEKTLDELNGELVGFVGQDRHFRAAGFEVVEHFDDSLVGTAMEMPTLLVKFEKKATALAKQRLVTCDWEATLHQHLRTIADKVAIGVKRVLWKTKMIKDGVCGISDVTQGIKESAVEIKYY
jgi:hypothetical protein